MVANAGITRDTLLLRMSDEDFDSVVDTNLGGAFRVVKRAAQGHAEGKLRPDRAGLQRRRPVGVAGQINYAASKAGLIGMARSLTRELGSRGITANVVAPGFIETDMTAAAARGAAGTSTRSQSRPAGSAAPPRWPRSIAWLAGDDAAYISGAVIPVDGGLGMGH